MLGKIFTVCMLLSVSACLVRSQPTSEEKIAGVADDVAALLGKLGAKSTDEAAAKLWAKDGKLSYKELEVLKKLLKSSDRSAVLSALQRPVTSKLTELDKMLAEYHKAEQMPAPFRTKMVEDINKTLVDINANAAKYTDIQQSIGAPYMRFNRLFCYTSLTAR